MRKLKNQKIRTFKSLIQVINIENNNHPVTVEPGEIGYFYGEYVDVLNIQYCYDRQYLIHFVNAAVPMRFDEIAEVKDQP